MVPIYSSVDILSVPFSNSAQLLISADVYVCASIYAPGTLLSCSLAPTFVPAPCVMHSAWSLRVVPLDTQAPQCPYTCLTPHNQAGCPSHGQAWADSWPLPHFPCGHFWSAFLPSSPPVHMDLFLPIDRIFLFFKIICRNLTSTWFN